MARVKPQSVEHLFEQLNRMLIGTPKCLASVGKQRQAINSMLQLLDKPENIDLAEQLELANFGDDHDADSLFLELVLWNNVMASSRLFADCLIVLSKDPILYQEVNRLFILHYTIIN